MQDNDQHATATQLQKDTAPAASPLGTDDEAAGNTPSADRVEIAREAEKKIDAAQAQRDSSIPYGKEEHQYQELAKQRENARVEEDPSEQPS